MDREFIGRQWLAWLETKGVGDVVRIRKNVWAGDCTARQRACRRGPNPKGRMEVFGIGHFFGSKRMKRGGRQSHQMVISNRFPGKQALALYRKRRGTERVFGHMKKKGFDLEATHMSEGHKLQKLFAVVVFAILFCFGWGCELKEKTQQATTVARRRKSLFRLGLEDLMRRVDPSQPPEASRSMINGFSKWVNSRCYSSMILV